MAKTSTERAVGQEGSLREGLETAIRERVREIIELVLEEEVASALGAPRSQRVAERSGYRHGSKPRRLTLRTGAVQMRVPRARLADPDGGEREWRRQLVPRYRRSSQEVEQSVLGRVGHRRHSEIRSFIRHAPSISFAYGPLCATLCGASGQEEKSKAAP